MDYLYCRVINRPAILIKIQSMTYQHELLLLLLFSTFSFLSSAQELNKQQLKYLKKNSHQIKMNGQSNMEQLPALDKALQNKRIVLLGEYTHGAKEINLVKNSMIKYLHEQLGYNVLLFESGIGEIMGIELDRGEKHPEQFISMGLFGPWRTKEYLDLMTYLKEKESLQVGGFDVQRSGQAFVQYLKEVIDLVDLEMGEDAIQVEKDYGDFVYRMRRNKFDTAMQNTKDSLALAYQQFHKKISDHKAKIRQDVLPKNQVLLVLKTLENRQAFIHYYLDFKKNNDYGKRWAARDSIMADNIIWFAENIYPNEKLIINAHNFHISKYNEKELVLGEVLFEKYQNDIYSIGIFGGEGEQADNSRKAEKLTPITESNDIKLFVQNSPAENTFISIPASTKKGGEWLHQEVIINDSFLDLYGGNTLVPGKSYDGLLFIKKISVPEYLR